MGAAVPEATEEEATVKRLEIMRLRKVIGSVEVPEPIGDSVVFQLTDGTELRLAVSQYKAHPARLQARLTKMETLMRIPGFEPYRGVRGRNE